MVGYGPIDIGDNACLQQILTSCEYRRRLYVYMLNREKICERITEINENVMQRPKQESRAIARKPRDVVRFGLMFADIRYKFKSSQAPKARLQSSRHTGEKSRI